MASTTSGDSALAAPKAPSAETPAPYHALDVAAVTEWLASSSEGLSDEEAARRLRVYGENVVPRVRRDTALRILWRQINSPLIWVLLASSGVAMALGKLVDGMVVLAVVLLNALIGFVQEYRARDAIEGLQAMVPENATVLRGERTQSLPVSCLVPGDIVSLASGDRVPADIRLFATKNLRVDESALTGESVAVEKGVAAVAEAAPIGDRTSMAYSGSLVRYGTATGMVVATGCNMEIGRISTLLSEATELETPLTRALAAIGRQITIAIGIVTVLMVGIGIARAMHAGLPAMEATREVLLFAIALAVGAIPEGLPAIVTIALAIGVRRMASRRAIIRKLPAVETLGSTTVICSDKTGTLTRNEMTARELWTPHSRLVRVEGVGYAPKGRLHDESGSALSELPADVARLLEHAALCSDATLEAKDGGYTITGDPTEAALVVAAEKAGIDVTCLRAQRERLDTIPFESEHRFMATLHRDEAGDVLILKGAPEAVLGRLEIADDEALGALRAQVERLAREGMRVLAIAHKRWSASDGRLEPEHVRAGLELSGLVGMIDPPRDEAVAAIGLCKQAGIVVKMITGDHEATAQAIGEELGIARGGSALSGSALSSLSLEALQESADRVGVFARVAPEHKLRLVDALQRRGHVVAMTGDGVNDAPALKQANIGIAMGISGTSAAKEAADMVLVDDNFATIVAAVEEGRRVYDNLLKSLAFVLPTNLALALIMIAAVVFFPFDPRLQLLLLPIAPTQLLWINLVAAVTLALPLAFEIKEPDVMARAPRDPRAPVLSRMLVIRTIVAAVLMTAGVLWIFAWEIGAYLERGDAPMHALAVAQTMAVTTAIAFQVFYVLNCRSLRAGLLELGLFSNRWVFAGIFAIVLLQAAFIYVPLLSRLFGSAALDLRELGVSVAVGALALPLMALEKRLSRGYGARGRDVAHARP